ncbi:FadR family transcriptional regulator [Rhodocaloribacter litoris]|uniref:FadR/GntR family transcriptional regulator n=1 Tax=Rhodocaloribacter litoris TaxID=2558931 RepID=UPI001422F35A|nr:FadR/GntR family transcriptional regulator [Rhodocaloribacter litoris]QXD14814.1 FadR family transcriptional regulator [Rhodocaloribacter litoris]GIV59095.1 MAG: GntR family transcriptional regulator [Rhodothermaceae bacterium]
MSAGFAPVQKSNLADDLADRLVQLIRARGYQPGDRLPSIMEMARSFGVGHPTLREALKKLESMGVVEIRHGAGVYVGSGHNRLLVSNPVFGGEVSKKLLLDLVEARIPIETTAVTLAATAATEEHLDRMAALLARAEANMDNDAVLSEANMAFHREIAVASGNLVLAQIQEVLTQLFSREQRVILGIYGSREKDHREHLGILDALRRRDAGLAEERMKTHLEGVRDVLLRWDPEKNPLPA